MNEKLCCSLLSLKIVLCSLHVKISRLNKFKFSMNFLILTLVFALIHFCMSFPHESEFPVITVQKKVKISCLQQENCTSLWENFPPIEEDEILRRWPWNSTFISNSTKYLQKEQDRKVYQVLESDAEHKFRLICEAKCPIIWRFDPAKEKYTEDLIYSFNVSTRRTAADVLDETTFKYEAELTIGGNSNQLTGTYSCECLDANISPSYIFIYWVGSQNENILLNFGKLDNIMKPDYYPSPWVGLDCGVSDLSKSGEIKLFKFKSYPRPKSLKRLDLGVYEHIELNNSIVRDHARGFLVNIREISHPFGQWACGREIDTKGEDSYQTMIHLKVEPYQKFEGWPWWKNMKKHPWSKVGLNISMSANKLSVTCCHLEYHDKGPGYAIPQTRIFYFKNEPTYVLVQHLIKKLRVNTYDILDTNILSGTCSTLGIPSGYEMFFRAVMCTNDEETKLFPTYEDLQGGFKNSTQTASDIEDLNNSAFIKTISSSFAYFDGEAGNITCEAVASRFSKGMYWIIHWRNGTKRQVTGESTMKINPESQIPGFVTHFQERMELDMANISCYVPDWKSSKWAISTVENYTIYSASRPFIWRNAIQNLALHLGDARVNLSCTIETTATNTVEWWRTNATSTNQTLISSKQYEPLYNTSLIGEIYQINFTEAAIGNYTCRATNLRGFDELTFVVTHKAHEPPKVEGQEQITLEWVVGEMHNSLDCSINGNPEPKITWTKNNLTLNESESLNIQGKKLTIVEVGINTEGTYMCYARSPYGSAKKTFKVNISKPKVSTIVQILSILGAVILALLCGAILYLVISRNKLKNKILMTENLINSFGGGIYFEENGQVTAKKLPYNFQTHEINRKLVVIGDAILGHGNFGVVRVGILRKKFQRKNVKFGRLYQKRIHLKAVAIKAPFLPKEDGEAKLSSGEIMDNFGSIITELRTMAFIKENFGKHPNIVEFFGACTANIENREVLILMELCQKGNLKGYLVANKKELSSQGFPFLQKLANWCSGIAAGLEFLESTNIVHIDLSARNILLSSEDIPKISDFGQARILQKENIEYIKRTKQPIPYLWTSIEALKEDRFSAKSDIWSYGVTIWEIYSCGDYPYLPGLPVGCQDLKILVDLLEKEVRLQQPAFATKEIYSQMRNCWKAEPQERPNISNLKEFFDELVRPTFSDKQILDNTACTSFAQLCQATNETATVPLHLEPLRVSSTVSSGNLCTAEAQSYPQSPYLQSVNLSEVINNL